MKRVAVGIIAKEFDSTVRYLLISAKKDFGEFTGLFYPPGGHVDVGETDEEAVAREVKEELGLDVEVVRRLAETEGDVADQVTTWWECHVLDEQEMIVQEDEIAEVRWMGIEEILREGVCWPATRTFFEEYI